MLRRLAVVMFWLSLGLPVRAGMIGDLVSLTWYDPNTSTIYLGPATATVGAGVEFPASTFPSNPAIIVDLTDTTIIFSGGYDGSNFSPPSFNGFGIFDQTNQNFIEVTVLSSANGWSSFDPGRVSFDSGHIYVDFTGLPLNTANQVVLDVSTTPEPGTLALLAAGLIGLGVAKRRFGASPR